MSLTDSLTATASLSDYIPVPSLAAQAPAPPPVPFSILPAPTTYVIVHRESEISRDVVQRLPENHQETINVVWVEETNEGIHSQLPHQVSRMVRERQQSQRIRNPVPRPVAYGTRRHVLRQEYPIVHET